MKKLLSIAFAILFTGSGIGHFVASKYYELIMPAYVPAPLVWIYISGFLELLAGTGLCIRKHRKKAAWLGFFLLIAFMPVHITHIKNGALAPGTEVPVLFLWIRLGLQLLMLAGLAWLAKDPSAVEPTTGNSVFGPGQKP